MTLESNEELNNIINSIRDNIIPIFEKMINNDNISFPNKNITNCWQSLDCKTNDCPLYGNTSNGFRCWQIAGTYCGGKPQGSFVEKYSKCSNCKVFKSSCPTIVEEIGEHFNNMVFLLKQKGKLLEDKERVERLNNELMSALEQLDKKNREIQEIMITDKLTGLYNRNYLNIVFEDEISRSSRYNRPLALIMGDIDSFKSYNDTYGHLEGDNMLSFMGALMRSDIRKFDRAFRYGGEEFVILLPESDSMLAYIVAERIRRDFEKKTFLANKGEEQVTASRTISMGITHTFTYTNIEKLISEADKALYRAKRKGGNVSVKYEDS